MYLARKHHATDAVSPYPTGDAETTVLIDDKHTFFSIPYKMTFCAYPHLHTLVNDTGKSDIVPEEGDESALYSLAVHTNTNLQCVTWDKICTATSGDVDIHPLVERIEFGIPDKRTPPRFK